MKPALAFALLLSALLAFPALLLPLTAAPAPTPDDIRAAVVKKHIPNALAILRNGGFSGFKIIPSANAPAGQPSAPQPPLADFLIQNIATDAGGHPVAETPLAAQHSRDIRPGDKLPYVMTNHPRATEPGSPANRHHRYALPFATANGPVSVVAGIRDLSPDPKTAAFGTLGMRDIVSLIGIFPAHANYMGAHIPKKEGYAVSAGPGYANATAAGADRFSHPLFPNPVPPSGSLWTATLLHKTLPVGRDADLPKFPPHRKNVLVPQLTLGKRAPFIYGTRDNPTRPLDTLAVILAFNNPNAAGTAPALRNRATQCERIYCTRELGYATRWDSWNCAQTPENIARARQAYKYANCGLPFDFSGKYSDHLEIGPVTEDKELGLYKHTMTLTDPVTGEKETRVWYMVGCHDYPNLEPRPPIAPSPIGPPGQRTPARPTPQ
ncbi:MAG: hypothetical protein LBR12_00725, partial [Opitutaceae bacterium]|nr:hypothetical protein [Opitutaceae bacterium]